MNVYENIVILNASLADEEIEAAITKIKEFVTGQGGEIVNISIWGKRKLSYEINRQKKGLYVLFVYRHPATIKVRRILQGLLMLNKKTLYHQARRKAGREP
jgi:small subunit ribosomal protein S6